MNEPNRPAEPAVERVGDGVYRVTDNGRADLVYVAGGPSGVWSFWRGRTFFEAAGAPRPRGRRGSSGAIQSLVAPMPATVVKVLVQPGATVRKGDTAVVLEAMKMELPLRVPGDATVKAVRCREGELVPPDAVLVELTPLAREARS